MIIGIMGWLIAPTRADAYVNAVLVVTYCSIGWAAGMMLSPDSTIEEKKFSSVWKGVSLFISGYLVSKLDPLIGALLTPEAIANLAEPLVAYRVLAGIGAVILTAILTYVVRVYVFTVRE